MKNKKAVTYLNGLTSSGKINTGSWSFTAADGNRLLGPDGDDWDQYGKVHLEIKTEAEEETKDRYGYPVAKFFGDEIQISRRGVIAAKAAASGARGATKKPEIIAAANSLLEAIDAKLEADGVEITDEMNKPVTEKELDACLGKKKKKAADRVDFMPWPEDGPDGNYMVERMSLTEDGFLKGRAIVTNVGVFPYLLEDGSVQYELRPPEEVFDETSIRSLGGVPMTNEHPEVKVTSDNAQGLSVGFTGNDVHIDQYHLAPSITITEKGAVQDAMKGKRALSAGYSVDLEMTSGVWMGIHYDAIQRNIRYNHVAIVSKGRAGDAARMKLDSANPVGVQKIDFKGASSMKKIAIDGMTFEVEENLAIAVQNKLDELEQVKKDALELGQVKQDLATKEASYDQLKEDNDQLKTKVEELEKADHAEEIGKAVKARLDLERAAGKAGVEIKEDSTDLDLKKSVILKFYPSAKEKLDSADDVYVNARYDGALEHLDDVEQNPPSSSLRGDSLGDPEPKKDGKEEKIDSDAAYSKMVDDMQNRYKRKQA